MEGIEPFIIFAKEESSGSLLPDGKKYTGKFGLQHRRVGAKG
jgi:hypothetical protein